MDKRELDRLHKLSLDYGLWAIGGKDQVGVVACWPETTLRKPQYGVIQPRRQVKRQNPTLTITQPLSTPTRPSSKPLLYKQEPAYSVIHGVAVRQDIPVKHIIVCLYYKQMPFRDVSMVTGLTSKRIGKLKYRFLSAINDVL